MKTITRVFTLLAFILSGLFSACGGGGGSENGDEPLPKTLLLSAFTDPAGPSALVKIRLGDAYVEPISTAGLKGVGGIGSLAYDTDTGKLFGTDTNDELVLLNPVTAQALHLGIRISATAGMAYSSAARKMYSLSSECVLTALDLATYEVTDYGTMFDPYCHGLAYDPYSEELLTIASDWLVGHTLVRIKLANGPAAAAMAVPLTSNVLVEKAMTYDTTNKMLYAMNTFNSDELITIDTVSGIVTSLGHTGVPGIMGMVYDHATNQLLASNSALFRIDPATAATSRIGFSGYNISILAGDPSTSTSLIGLDTLQGILVRVDKSTGLPSLVSDVSWLASLATDHNSGTIYGIAQGSAFGGDNLVVLDPANGSLQVIGDTGFSGIDSITYDPVTERLFGRNSVDSVTEQLVDIDPDTGAATLIAAIDVDPNLTSITFDSNRNRMVGANRHAELFEINVGSGQTVLLGQLPMPDIEEIMYDYGDDRFYAITGTGDLYHIDPVTLSVSSIGILGANIRSLTYDDNSQTLYGVTTSSVNNHYSFLVEVDPTSGTSTSIGNLGDIEVDSITYDGYKGLIYGYGFRYGQGYQLITIDPTSAATQIVADDGQDFDDLVFDPRSNNLFAFFGGGALGTLSQQSGQLIFDSVGGHYPPHLESAAIEPVTGSIYGFSYFGAQFRLDKNNAERTDILEEHIFHRFRFHGPVVFVP